MTQIIIILAEILGLLFSIGMILGIVWLIFTMVSLIVAWIRDDIKEAKLKKENKISYKKGYDDGYSAAFDLIDDWDKAKRSYIKWRN